MNRHNKQTKFKKYLFWLIIILICVMMVISFSPTPEMTEIILFP